ncbi:MAG: tRNA adenosine(34) deaminase TadA [Acidimicrobiia bacterium]
MVDALLEGWMRQAIDQARAAVDHDDVPVGALLVDGAGEVVAEDHNRREALQDPTAHAELLVLSAASRRLGSWRLDGYTLVVTLEPCPMCAGAAVNARVARIVYGAADPKAGAAWSFYNIPQDARLNHRCELVAGVLEEECASLLNAFFLGQRDDVRNPADGQREDVRSPADTPRDPADGQREDVRSPADTPRDPA